MKNRTLNREWIGEFIRDKRLEMHYSQDELANLLGISKTAVSKWENGKFVVDVKYLVYLSNILNVTIDDILFPDCKSPGQQYCDISQQFQDMLYSAHRMKRKQVEKLLGMYVENKKKMVYLLEQFIQTEDPQWLEKAREADCFGLALSPDDSEAFVYLEEKRILKYRKPGDVLETMWAPAFFADFTSNDNASAIEKHLPHIFHSEWAISYFRRGDTRGLAMSARNSMMELIFVYGGRRIFLEYIKIFSKKIRNEILRNLKTFSEMTNRKTDQMVIRAMRLLLKGGAEYWVDGEDRTQELMREIL